jgi:hypothetical protein
MATTRHTASRGALLTLDAAAQAAREGFACLFSTSDEYEAALIARRRAEGRYRRSHLWPIVMAIGCGLTLAGLVLVSL